VLWVIKLGGSLARSTLLPRWLEALARHGGGRAVIVPGGGPYADLVRGEQQRWRFPDRHAHRMALRGMDQYGLSLSGMEPRLEPANSRQTIERILARGGVPVWLPTAMLDTATDVEASWQVTSDSLAAWFARQLAITHLLLVKSVAFPSKTLIQHDLIAQGIVDLAFARWRGKNLHDVRCVGPDDYEQVPGILSATADLGCRVVLSRDP
jgi:aspartokinase-like uncharacterized kinase